MTHIIAACALALVACATQVSAQDYETTAVRTSDLNLSRPRDVARLHARVKYAARLVCQNADRVFPEAAKEMDACERETRELSERLAIAKIEQVRSQLASR